MTETRDLLLTMAFASPGEKGRKRPTGEGREGRAGREGSAAARGGRAGRRPRRRPKTSPPRSRPRGGPTRATGPAKLPQECPGNGRRGRVDRRHPRQLTNNRIDTDELKSRLGAGIAEPLHRICDEMFPELEQRLEPEAGRAADAQAGPGRRDAARIQADAILLAMRGVLSRMVELEDFNELVERLRTIVQLQEKIHRDTQKRHNQRIHYLTEK